MKLGLCLFLGLSMGLGQTVNCLVAVVNGQAVTLTDVQIVVEFGLYPGSSSGPQKDPRWIALEALIDRKVVLEVTRGPSGAEKEEMAGLLDFLREDMGGEEFARKLREYGLLENDLLPYIEEKILFDRAVVMRFNQNVPVSRTDVEKYYRDVYVPEQTRLGVPASPIADVLTIIETRIRERNRARQVDAWVKGLRERAEIQIKPDCLK